MWSLEPRNRATLAWILAPMSVDEFRTEYFERRPLHLARNVAGYYDRYFSLSEYERILFGSPVTAGDISVVKDGVPARQESYVVQHKRTRKDKRPSVSDRIEPDLVASNFGGGCTVVFDRVDRFSTSLAALGRQLSLLWRCNVQPNVYMTPPGNQGFATHYDTHDTAILQIAGSKHWRVYDSPIELPLETQPHDKKTHIPSKTLLDVQMNPGDVLYIPRGFMHDATANEELSLHVTLGIHQQRWIDVLTEALSRCAHAEALLRRNASPEQAAAVSQAVTQLLTPELLAQLLDESRSRYVKEIHRNDLEGQLAQVAALRHLSDDSIVAMRADMLYDLEQTEKATRLTYSNKTLTLPLSAAAIVNELESRSTVRVGELIKHDDKASTIVRKLIQEGFAVQLLAHGERENQTAVA